MCIVRTIWCLAYKITVWSLQDTELSQDLMEVFMSPGKLVYTLLHLVASMKLVLGWCVEHYMGINFDLK